MKLVNRLWIVVLIVAVASTIPIAFAHHSGAEFDMDKVVEVTGTIKEFQFKNPHSWIQVLVPNAKGGTVEWSLEWGSPNALGRQGIRVSTFPVGSKVVMRMNPMRSGAAGGLFIGAKFEDGK